MSAEFVYHDTSRLYKETAMCLDALRKMLASVHSLMKQLWQ